MFLGKLNSVNISYHSKLKFQIRHSYSLALSLSPSLFVNFHVDLVGSGDFQLKAVFLFFPADRRPFGRTSRHSLKAKYGINYSSIERCTTSGPLNAYNSIKIVALKQNPHSKLDSKESELQILKMKKCFKSFVSCQLSRVFPSTWILGLVESKSLSKWDHTISTRSMDSSTNDSFQTNVWLVGRLLVCY